jgi:RNA polymerase sigma factor (sigma-70 family)
MPPQSSDKNDLNEVRKLAFRKARVLIGPDKAEDIAQDIVLRVIQGNITLPAEKRVRQAYITKIAKNLCIDNMRRQKRVVEFLADSLIEQVQGSPEGTEALTPDEAVAQVLQELGPSARNAFLLYMESCSVADVVTQTGLSQATVYRYISTAKSKICMLLKLRGGR